MRDVLLVRYGEVFLKGANRPYFLRMLTENVRKAVKPVGGHVWLSDARIYVSDFSDLQDCIARVTRVFGVHSVSPAVEMEKDLDAISAVCIRMMQGRSGTFKVFARRSDKSFPMNSMEIGQEIGGRVLEVEPEPQSGRPQAAAAAQRRDSRQRLRLRGGDSRRRRNADGHGRQGGAAALRRHRLARSGLPADEARRALLRDPLPEPPYTGELARDKVMTLAKELSAYCGGMRVYLVPFTKCQLEIHEKCPDGLGTLITRRFMMRIAEKIARKYGAQALITGESLGQVASQTMEALVCTDAVVEMPVFRPLIGLDKTEIMEIAEKIGTYETSILPYEDCCTVFTPRHPVTKPKLDTMPDAERKLDIDALVDEAVENTETEWVE